MTKALKHILLFCSLLLLSHYYSIGQDESYAFALISMNVESNTFHSQVNWKVHKDEPGHIYVIQKSIDKETWTEKARIPSEEPDSIIYDYHYGFEDQIENSVEYYRLVRISPDGYEDQLRIYSVFHKVLSKIKISSPPGQSNKYANIEYSALFDVSVKITVETIEGDVVYEAREQAIKGENYHSIKLKKIKAGRYLVIVRDPKENKVQRALTVY